MENVVATIAKALVDNPESVHVEKEENSEGEITISLSVAKEDMGKVIGRQGRIAKALRTVVKAAAARADKKVTVNIVE